MSRRRRILLRVLTAGATAVALLALWVYFTLDSEWFFDQVRTRLISVVETATGGHVEIAGLPVRSRALHRRSARLRPARPRAGR